VYDFHNAYKDEYRNVDLSYVQLYDNVGISILFINFIDLTNLAVMNRNKFRIVQNGFATKHFEQKQVQNCS